MSMKERRSAPKQEVSTSGPNVFQQMAADNKILRDESARLSSKVSALSSRVESLEGFRSAQETFNTGTMDRIGKLQPGNDSLCPGCGNPQSVGVHSVACFTTVGK